MKNTFEIPNCGKEIDLPNKIVICDPCYIEDQHVMGYGKNSKNFKQLTHTLELQPGKWKVCEGDDDVDLRHKGKYMFSNLALQVKIITDAIDRKSPMEILETGSSAGVTESSGSESETKIEKETSEEDPEDDGSENEDSEEDDDEDVPYIYTRIYYHEDAPKIIPIKDLVLEKYLCVDSGTMAIHDSKYFGVVESFSDFGGDIDNALYTLTRDKKVIAFIIQV